MAALFAFLHHVAAFTLVAALVVEFVLIGDALTVRSARKLQLADLVFGASAGVVLVAGLLRVFHFEKGAAYYFHSPFFVAKFSLFVIVAMLSIIPTVEFLSWRKSVQRGEAPLIAARKLRALRAILHWELAALVVLVLCAALMAKGGVA